jgi:chromosome segregation ATPase
MMLQEFSTLEAEMEELRASIEAARQEARDAAAAIEENEALLEGGRGELEAAKEAVREAKAEVAAEKERLNKQNKEMHQMGQRKDKLAKDQSDRELEMKKLKHATDKIRVSLKIPLQIGPNGFKIGATGPEILVP